MGIEEADFPDGGLAEEEVAVVHLEDDSGGSAFFEGGGHPGEALAGREDLEGFALEFARVGGRRWFFGRGEEGEPGEDEDGGDGEEGGEAAEPAQGEAFALDEGEVEEIEIRIAVLR